MFHAFFIIILLLVAQPSPIHPRSLRSTDFQSHHHLQQNSFESIQKSNVSIAGARRYLHAFGYLDDDEYDELGLEKAVKKFQEYYNLNVSGKLDSETTKLMLLPRCGVPDHHHHHHHHHNHDATNDNKHIIGSNLFKFTSKYAFLEGILQWPDSSRNLTYTFDSVFLPQEVIRDAFKVAFEQWSSVSPFTFEEAPEGTSPDLVIGFYSGDHGDDEPFDKFGPILAHSFGPLDGRLHLNLDEPWSTQVPIQEGFYDLVWVAMHELGHTLGLGHSHHRDAVMHAYVFPGINKRVLGVDDINGIKGLYSLPIRVDSPAMPLRCDYYHLLIIAILCSLVIFMFSDIATRS